jgi:hypothetical protein
LSNLNLITVCTDAYPMEYARKLITRFKKLTEYDVTAWCITDRPDEISDIANVIEPPFGAGKGWWNKIKAYDSFYEGHAVYMDIDTVLIQNFDEELEDAITQLDIQPNVKVACVSDAIMWKNNKYSSSMMVLKSGKMQDVHDLFLLESWRLFDYDGGDQVWTGNLLKEWEAGGYADVYYMDEANPKLKMNLKFHLGKKIFGQWKFPDRIPPQCKIVDCGGQPKPHQLEMLPYIKKAWHDVK